MLSETFKNVAGGIAVSMVVGFAADAHANCARPTGYHAKVDGYDVEICPTNFEQRGCGEGDTLLRENLDTGDVVVVDDGFCVGDCYVDECVRGGKYRYGFEKPYKCHPTSCSTDYNTLVEVEDRQVSCLRSLGTPPPKEFEGKLPWPKGGDDWSPSICDYGEGRDDSNTIEIITGGNLALLAFGLFFVWHRRRDRWNLTEEEG